MNPCHQKVRLFILVIPLMILQNMALTQTYFPPDPPGRWETVQPEDLGWCTDALNDFYTFLDTTNTKGFIILHQGKIAAEEYFNNHDMDKNWYWASAGKSLASVLFGIAQDQGDLDIHDPTSQYLGTGWTSLTPAQEEKVTLWHHLTFTTGFDNNNVNVGCFDPECFRYLTDPGERWFYHNGTYTIMHDILEAATGLNSNQFTLRNVANKIGMDGFWLNLNPTTKLYWSTTRSAARFGWMVANQASWNGQDIISDKDYVADMLQTSQNDNPSYGYLWWLNGKDAHHLPGLYFRFNSPLNIHAPDDMVSGLGANGQFIEIIPSMDLVIVRMGESTDDGLTASAYHLEYWEKLNKVFCSTTSSDLIQVENIEIFPNPASHQIHFSTPNIASIHIFDIKGRIIHTQNNSNSVDISTWLPGQYQVEVNLQDGSRQRKKMIKK